MCQNQHFPHHPRQSRPQRPLHQESPHHCQHPLVVSWSSLLLLLFYPKPQVWCILVVIFMIWYGVEINLKIKRPAHWHIKKYCDFRKFYPVRKIQLNLIDIKIQFIYPNFVIYRVFIDQGLNVLFQLYYNDLGPEIIFKIWWTTFFLEFIGKM